MLQHSQNVSMLFYKVLHTIRYGVGRSSNLGCCDYDIQFRLKNERNPGISFVNVLQDLCLMYIRGPLAPSYQSKNKN